MAFHVSVAEPSNKAGAWPELAHCCFERKKTYAHFPGADHSLHKPHTICDNMICCCYLVTKSYLILLWSMDCSPAGSSVHRYFPGKKTGVSCHFLLQGIFLTQKSSLHLLHCRWILYHWATREAHNMICPQIFTELEKWMNEYIMQIHLRGSWPPSCSTSSWLTLICLSHMTQSSIERLVLFKKYSVSSSLQLMQERRQFLRLHHQLF